MTVQTERPPSGPADVTKRGERRPAAPRSASRAGALAPYLLLLPACTASVLLLGWPLLKDVLLSFQNLNMAQLIQHATEWNGIDNYKEVLTGEDFWRVTLRSIVFTAVNVVLTMVLGTLVGLLLARLGKRMRLLLMIGLVLAWAMPVVAATTVYQWLFAQRFGVVNWVLDRLGWHSMADYSWTSSQMSTFFVVTLLIVWMSIPFVAINLYAATTVISAELYEAAALDGAGAWKSFTTVTLPVLRPFLYATTFLEVIWIFKAFVQVYVINAGGPDRLTEILPVYAYIEGVGNQHYGMGAAIAVLTILILLAITAYYLRIVLKQDEEGEL
ncbi:MULTISPECIES: carbohydrate ABC transporter permease [unclassified Streptomyces]|uniref:carbohydrate ABC transporter permease n=1 Tax=unclassified Streptomyces TaxID=2593676 RepID=UPI001661FEAA|nr:MULTISPECIES: sugar ABC transporter permease [unclassified Streptomyces]MBD0843428.1 sugar ABC transporter permease [Streptomyces sp. TRM68416]